MWKPEDDIDGAFKKAKDQVRTCSSHAGTSMEKLIGALYTDSRTCAPVLENQPL